jgi:hypothetical protein
MRQFKRKSIRLDSEFRILSKFAGTYKLRLVWNLNPVEFLGFEKSHGIFKPSPSFFPIRRGPWVNSECLNLGGNIDSEVRMSRFRF